MSEFLVAAACLALALVALVLRKTYFYVPRKELQRQAATRDPLAATLWRAAAYGNTLQVLLWLVVGLGAAAGFVLFARIAPPLFGFVVVALALWFGFAWMPSTRLTSLGARLAVWCTPAVVWLVATLQPVLQPVAGMLERFPLGPHTGAYEREDLLDVLARQKQQADNRVPQHELELAERALRFGDYKIRDVLVPRAQVHAVRSSEPIGPVLMDELHASQHRRFPVYEGDDKNNIVGTLYLRDIVDSKKGGTVADYTDHHAFYVHENDSLADALHALSAAKQQVLLVVNSHEEYLGIVTSRDVLGKLLAAPAGEAFDHHDDRAAVARKHDYVEPKPVQEPAEAVAEQPAEPDVAIEPEAPAPEAEQPADAVPLAETPPEVVK
ncbi:MAG TPA: CBS domain-containing protein [Candidatus Saccharimonadales bacterium]|nr:CBS domain-containing protein [Candidatus Saccharimonadales bacterium]